MHTFAAAPTRAATTTANRWQQQCGPTHWCTSQYRQYMCLLCASMCYLCVSIDLPFCSCRGFYWVSGCCNCNRNFKVADSARVVAVARMLWLLLFVRSISKRHSILLRAEAQLKFYAHLHLQYMAHAWVCVNEWVCGWVGVFVHRPTSTQLVVIAPAAAAQVGLPFLLRNWKRLSAIAQGQMQVRVSVCVCVCVSECGTSMRSKCGK